MCLFHLRITFEVLLSLMAILGYCACSPEELNLSLIESTSVSERRSLHPQLLIATTLGIYGSRVNDINVWNSDRYV